MTEDRKINVANALHKFRNTVLEHSLSLTHIIVEGIEAKPAPSQWTAERLRKAQMGLLEKYFPNAKDFASTPRDFLNLDIDVLNERYNLDGVTRKLIDLAKREQWLENLWQNVAALEATNTETSFPPGLPEDFKLLIMKQDSILGPYFIAHHRTVLAPPFYDISFETETTISERVLRPVRDDGQFDDYVPGQGEPNPFADPTKCNELTYVWAQWDIAVAIKIGSAQEYQKCWICYCKGIGREWQWRYGISSRPDCGSELYDSVEEFLVFFAHYQEKSKEEMERAISGSSIDPGVVWENTPGPMWLVRPDGTREFQYIKGTAPDLN